jgi:predicted 3-demethylubiquinone-9 3-methyltransferase (glyoxalase superfamily)
MTTVRQFLWFEKDMEPAVRFYTALIPGSRIEWGSAVPNENPSGPPESVRTMSFTLAGQRYGAIQAGPYDAFNHAFSIMVECDDQAELDRIWDGFLDGGTAEQCGWLRDRWGLSWQIVPRRLGELLNDPDRQKARRVGEAMMKMVKLDIAGLEAAAGADQDALAS